MGPNPSPPVPQLQGHLQTHLLATVPLIHKPPELKCHVPGEGLQLLQGHAWDLQPLQVKQALLVVGHLGGHKGTVLQWKGWDQPWGPREHPPPKDRTPGT